MFDDGANDVLIDVVPARDCSSRRFKSSIKQVIATNKTPLLPVLDYLTSADYAVESEVTQLAIRMRQEDLGTAVRKNAALQATKAEWVVTLQCLSEDEKQTVLKLVQGTKLEEEFDEALQNAQQLVELGATASSPTDNEHGAWLGLGPTELAAAGAAMSFRKRLTFTNALDASKDRPFFLAALEAEPNDVRNVGRLGVLGAGGGGIDAPTGAELVKMAPQERAVALAQGGDPTRQDELAESVVGLWVQELQPQIEKHLKREFLECRCVAPETDSKAAEATDAYGNATKVLFFKLRLGESPEHKKMTYGPYIFVKAQEASGRPTTPHKLADVDMAPASPGPPVPSGPLTLKLIGCKLAKTAQQELFAF